jgi:hypothetical protein
MVAGKYAYMWFIAPLCIAVNVLTAMFLSEIPFAYLSIVILIIMFFLYVKNVVKSTEKLLAPFSILIYFYYIFAIFGIYMWIYREIYLENRAGDIYFVTNCFVVTAILLACFAVKRLSSYPDRRIEFNPYTLRIKGKIFFILLLLQYFGAYLYTAGFAVIPILSDNIDIARLETLDEYQSKGRGMGSVLIYTGLLCIISLFFSKQYSLKVKIPLSLIVYFPFLMYGGRLYMLYPILLIGVIMLLKNNYKPTLKNSIKILCLICIILGGMMFYGTYRARADEVKDFFIDYMTADLFPEYRGAVAAYHLNKEDLSAPLISSCTIALIPGAVADAVGVDKSARLSIGGYVAELFGITGIGIRTSFTGEILLTNPITYLFFWLILLLFVVQINKNYFKSRNLSYKKVGCVILGIYCALVIPYGTGLLPILIILMAYLYTLMRVLKFKN